MLFAAADCRLWTPPAPDQLLRSATVSAPGPHKRRPGVGRADGCGWHQVGEVRFALASAQEEDGFEPSVPREKTERRRRSRSLNFRWLDP
jgi:hypothetical protein